MSTADQQRSDQPHPESAGADQIAHGPLSTLGGGPASGIGLQRSDQSRPELADGDQVARQAFA